MNYTWNGVVLCEDGIRLINMYVVNSRSITKKVLKSSIIDILREEMKSNQINCSVKNWVGRKRYGEREIKNKLNK